ncbi:hypothetical protein BaRGS_00034350 [Batillaria attramentaria]|uniref:Uncharacterized protein n=1 Tax=Batillaria attramentaria TaxID=370345 RepID=A0ABD0JHU4_9CAEN
MGFPHGRDMGFPLTLIPSWPGNGIPIFPLPRFAARFSNRGLIVVILSDLESASVRDERIGTYRDVSARTKASQIGDPDRDDRVRWRPNHGLDGDTPVGTYVIVSERETSS